jgi:hypothetical protein
MEVDASAPWADLPLPVIEAAFKQASEDVADERELAAAADERLRRAKPDRVA